MRPTNGSPYWGLYGQLVPYLPGSELVEEIRVRAIKNEPFDEFIDDRPKYIGMLDEYWLRCICEPDVKNYLYRSREMKALYTLMCSVEGEKKSFTRLKHFAKRAGWPYDWQNRLVGWPKCPFKPGRGVTVDGVNTQWETFYQELKSKPFYKIKLPSSK